MGILREISKRSRVAVESELFTMATRSLRSHPNNFVGQYKSGKAAVSNMAERKVLGDITDKQNLANLPPSKVMEKEIYSTNDEIECMDTNDDANGFLPVGVQDIDSKDVDNPQLCAEYVTETFAYLKGLERKALVPKDHLQGQQTNDKMRAVLVDWLVEVQVQFKLLQETLFSTIDIIDRFMAVEGGSVSRGKLQLVGVAAMFLASKIEEVYAPACSDFVYITDNAYTEEEIKATELKIVKALDFNLSQPVAINFLRRYSKAGDVDVLQHSLAKYCLELSLADYSLVCVGGSELAAASLCLSLLVLEEGATVQNVWSPTLAYFSGYNLDSILPLVRKLAAVVVKTHKPNAKLQAVRTKYKSSKFLRVADLGELKSDVILKLAL